MCQHVLAQEVDLPPAPLFITENVQCRLASLEESVVFQKGLIHRLQLCEMLFNLKTTRDIWTPHQSFVILKQGEESEESLHQPRDGETESSLFSSAENNYVYHMTLI